MNISGLDELIGYVPGSKEVEKRRSQWIFGFICGCVFSIVALVSVVLCLT